MQSGSAYQSAPSYQQQQQPSQPQPQPQPTPQQAPPPPNFHPYYSLMPETSRERFYDILSGLDPYRSTPKEFIHLLVHAATRDREIADALIRLNHDRIHNPSTWRPTAPPNFAAQPLPPNQAPGSGRPVAPQPPPPPPPHQAFGQPLSGTPAAPSPAQEGTARPRKRKRKEANAGPKPNWRRTIMYMPPHQAPQTRVPPAQPQNLNHMQVNVAPTQQNPSAPVPVPEQQGVPSLATTFTPPNIERRYSESPTSDAYDAYEKAVKPIHGEPKERACNYTWTLDRAEVHLGFTGQYDGMTEQRQLSIGFEVALKLQKYLKRLNAALDNNVTVANRVHILTVMREILAATLEADNTLGKECRECSREYDSTYLAAVRKLTPEQLSRLKSLEHGKWLEEFQDLITVATRQNMFPLLKKAFDHINSAV
ncbi:hypothetical protein F4808DRAFT_89317 [Astrocystis sublimbata]|nr:hypothetical protein F4808DRAFT_89317 [Astrocystis sublimbata]